MTIYWFFALLVFITFASSEVFIYTKSRPDNSLTTYDYLIVLGGGKKSESPVIRDRVLNALEAASLHPNAKIIFTGNERIGEITIFKNLLIELDKSKTLTPERVLFETESRNTWDNIRNSLNLAKNPDARFLIVTSEYHQNRALAVARIFKAKANATGKDKTTYSLWLYHFVKERLSNLLILIKSATAF